MLQVTDAGLGVFWELGELTIIGQPVEPQFSVKNPYEFLFLNAALISRVTGTRLR